MEMFSSPLPGIIYLSNRVQGTHKHVSVDFNIITFNFATKNTETVDVTTYFFMHLLGPDPVVLGPNSMVLGPHPVVLGPNPLVLEPDLVVLGPDRMVLGPDPVVIGPDPVVF